MNAAAARLGWPVDKMFMSECHIPDLKRAYEVLGLPLSASAISIRQTYRRMAKRWHPDLHQSGTPAHIEATQMMSLINEAYEKIQHAPLRYHIEAYPVAQDRRQRSTSSVGEKTAARRDTLPVTDRLEFWVRFVSGALFGAFIMSEFAIDLFDHPSPAYLGALLAGALILMLSCGLAAARYGDRFWSKVLEYWWVWR